MNKEKETMKKAKAKGKKRTRPPYRGYGEGVHAQEDLKLVWVSLRAHHQGQVSHGQGVVGAVGGGAQALEK